MKLVAAVFGTHEIIGDIDGTVNDPRYEMWIHEKQEMCVRNGSHVDFGGYYS